MEACNGMNYLRAGEETHRPLPGRLLKELGEESNVRRTSWMALLERACERKRGRAPKNAVPSFPWPKMCYTKS